MGTLSFAIRSGMAVLMLCSVCGCARSVLAVRAPPMSSPLRLEVTTTDGAVRPGARVAVHVRLWNPNSVPIRNVDIALIHTPSLLPVGGSGSSVARTDYGVLNIDRIMRLDPGGFAEWWLVLRAVRPGDASASAIATPVDAHTSVETVQWHVLDGTGAPDAIARDDDPATLARAYIASSQEYRASGRHRDELHALYTARAFIEQAAAKQLAVTPWADLADRASELYLAEYGARPAPVQQAALPRTSVLNGVVLDKSSQAPIAAATVTLHSILTDTIYAKVTTATDGEFQIPDLGTEPVIMVIAMPGYLTSMHSGFEMSPDAITRLVTELEPAPVVSLQQISEGRDLAELHGTLTGYYGDGAANVEVLLVGADTRAVLTDAQGEFRFTEVMPGDYAFVAQKPGYAAIQRDVLNLSPGGVFEVQFTLEPE